jgi:hypothetical protein
VNYERLASETDDEMWKQYLEAQRRVLGIDDKQPPSTPPLKSPIGPQASVQPPTNNTSVSNNDMSTVEASRELADASKQSMNTAKDVIQGAQKITQQLSDITKVDGLTIHMKLEPIKVEHTGIDLANVDDHLKGFTTEIVTNAIRKIKFPDGTYAGLDIDAGDAANLA